MPGDSTAAVATGGFARLTPGLFAAGIGVALLSSAIPYTLEMIVLKELPARTFGILMSLEPAVAALAGLVFLHEVLSLRQWLAVALVVAASTGATLTSRRAEQVAEGESGRGGREGDPAREQAGTESASIGGRRRLKPQQQLREASQTARGCSARARDAPASLDPPSSKQGASFAHGQLPNPELLSVTQAPG